jgi:hypothetical protein
LLDKGIPGSTPGWFEAFVLSHYFSEAEERAKRVTSRGKFVRKVHKTPKGKGWRRGDRTLLIKHLLGEAHKKTGRVWP